jgi:hypothetical protein
VDFAALDGRSYCKVGALLFYAYVCVQDRTGQGATDGIRPIKFFSPFFLFFFFNLFLDVRAEFETCRLRDK